MRKRFHDPTMTDAEYERMLEKEYPRPIPRRKERIDVEDLLITISLFAVFPAGIAMLLAMLFSFRVAFILLAGIMAWTAYLSMRRKEIMFVRWTVRWEESPTQFIVLMIWILLTIGLVLAMAYMIGNVGIVHGSRSNGSFHTVLLTEADEDRKTGSFLPIRLRRGRISPPLFST